KSFVEKTDRNDFFSWLDKNRQKTEFIVHIGARTDTAENDKRVFDRLNLGYSKQVWTYCVKYDIPLIYASSAATYGMGEFGFDDNHDIIKKLIPLNLYGESKNDFDKWVLEQDAVPPFWAGFKFFNVYGPNEYHKNRMASVVFHTYNQIKETGKMKLFRSHNINYKDGEQRRDFIYVKDIMDVLFYFMNHKKDSGIFNLGTGTSRTFFELAASVFTAMGKKNVFDFIDTPADIRDNYQYFTEARMSKLRTAGYSHEFTTLESGIKEYIMDYLSYIKYS
ncbi:MAG: ADP-glyceromanno-heptose 6-epimerase, partial [Actinobacteria bacterium]|nr:ADP-glyceromanno-heptose 6-epimerase [Actinomycetota bacterium]